MGKTAYAGPVYGAKSLLWSVHRDNQLPAANDTTTVTIASIRVPAYENWLVTEFKGYRGSSGSTAVTSTWNLTDDSTVIASLVTPATSSDAGIMLSTTPTATPGEYEGVLVAENSTLAITISHGGSSAAISSNITAWVYGYIRYIDSTRSV